MTEDISKKGFAFHELQDFFKGLKLLRKLPMSKVEVSSLNFDYCCFQLHFLRFPSRCRILSYSGTRRRRYLLTSQWIHFVHTPVDSIAYACNFIMEAHLHQSALAFKKELDAGLARRFLFPNFPGLIVMQLH